MHIQSAIQVWIHSVLDNFNKNWYAWLNRKCEKITFNAIEWVNTA